MEGDLQDSANCRACEIRRLAERVNAQIFGLSGLFGACRILGVGWITKLGRKGRISMDFQFGMVG